MAPATLFTLGYQQRSLIEYLELLQEAEINVLVDVRATAWSHKPGFSKSALARALAHINIEYVHAPFVGNPKHLRTAAKSHQECLEKYEELLVARVDMVDMFEQLVAEYLQNRKRVCITCFERHPDDCHRSILANHWRCRGRRRVKHLASNGASRLY